MEYAKKNGQNLSIIFLSVKCEQQQNEKHGRAGKPGIIKVRSAGSRPDI